MKIIWSNDSLDDVDRIREYISLDAEFYAQIFVEKIIQISDRLKNFPMSGRVVPEFNNESIREIIFRNYRIIYEITEENIIILSVIHGSKLLDDRD
jgi:addiction module RelE/StbE family toxin